MKQIYLKRRKRPSSQLPAITLTPLIDTVLVLLIVFMVTSTGMRVSQQPAEAPVVAQEKIEQEVEQKIEQKIEEKKEPEKPVAHNSLFVRVTSKGFLFINQERVARKNFRAGLANALKKLKEPLKIILLKFEPGVPLALVQEIKRFVHQAEGIHGVYEVK